MKRLPVILGLDPSARHIGLAIFRGAELIFFTVRTFQRKTKMDSLKRLREILKEIIINYRIEYIALEKAGFIQQKQSFVQTVAEEIKNHLKTQAVVLYEYEPKFIKRSICQNEKPTKQKTFQLLAERYGELTPYSILTRRWQKRYFGVLCDAVAVAVVCGHELMSKH